jgi:glycosyltransferase involved in cell wall biosynthesis
MALTKLGILVGEDKWLFFREIYADLASHYQTEIYQRRIYTTPLLYGRLNRWAFREGIRAMLRRNDVCFFEWASELLMVASHLPKRCPVITRLHSFELYEWAPRINWDAVDKVILVSRAMERQFRLQYPDHAHKTEVVFNGTSLDKFGPPAEQSRGLNLGMLCSITPIKRVYETVLMLYHLKVRGYDLRLCIAGAPVGDFRYAAAVYRLVDKLKLADSVVFDGYVSDSAKWLQGIDIFISNSLWEGQQVALLEAMATGCYCLSHFWDGAEEVLPSENLYVTERELRDKIVQYCDSSETWRQEQQARMRTRASDRFDIERTKRQIRQVVEKVVLTTAGGGRTQ